LLFQETVTEPAHLPPTETAEADPYAFWVTMPAGSPPPTPQEPPPAWPEVPGYDIHGELGRGVLGVVYRALWFQANRLVALKIIQADKHADPKEMARFRAEGEALTRLQHPNIVQVYEVGEADDRPYLALEYVEGGTLARKLEGKPLAAREAAKFLYQLARAVQAAHERSIVHRNLKPANVLLTSDGSPKIADFGLAKCLETEGGVAGQAAIFGTPSYLAPEQVMGHMRAGSAADVYALGAIFYELLTGRPPFVADTPVNTVAQVVSDEPVPPSLLHPKLPADLEAICLKCLEKDLLKRYSSARALADDVDHWLAGKPTQARPPLKWERAVKWVRRRPAAAGMLAAGVGIPLLAFGLVLALVFGQWRRAEDQAAQALHEKTKAEEKQRRAEKELAKKGEARQEKQRTEKPRVPVQPRSLVGALLKANPQAVPHLLQELQVSNPDILSRLRRLWRDQTLPQRQRLRVGLALLPVDPATVLGPLFAGMLAARDPHEVRLLRDALRPSRGQFKAVLWRTATDSKAAPERRFRALVALATFDPEGRGWQTVAPRVVEQLLTADPLNLGPWTTALRPARSRLLRPLCAIFRGDPRADRRLVAAVVLADYAADLPRELVGLVADADPQQFTLLLPNLRRHRASVLPLLKRELVARPGPVLIHASYPDRTEPKKAKDALARRRANAAVALLHLDQGDLLWPLLRGSPDPRLRSYLIHGLAPLGVPPRLVRDRLREERHGSARRALLLALGEYAPERLGAADRKDLVARLLKMYRLDPDAGVHAAVDWLLRRWHEGASLDRIDRKLAGSRDRGQRQWYVNGQRQTLAVLRGPVEFRMGSPGSEPDRFADEVPHRRRIGRSFALATKPVTVDQFTAFLKAHPDVGHSYNKKFSPDPTGPIIGVTWYEAAMYCQWLSEREGIPRDQWCYPSVAEMKAALKAGKPIRLPKDYLHRTGYRLPTEAEWEYACRAGTVTGRCYGADEALLGNYAWYAANSGNRSRPVGLLKPNDFGLFDMHGNVWQWCLDRYLPYPPGGKRSDDHEDKNGLVIRNHRRVLRGGAFSSHALLVRSALRNGDAPGNRNINVGLRVARTYR
jgi:formylglycine-generating enzyme required for sulfatase activity